MLDFVGFTEMSVAQDPAALIAELNDLPPYGLYPATLNDDHHRLIVGEYLGGTKSSAAIAYACSLSLLKAARK